MPLPPIPALPTPGSSNSWYGLNTSAAAMALARVSLEQGTTLLALAADNPAADRLETALRFFLPAAEQHRVLRFPDWEILPYDVFSPHQDLVSQRLKTLHQLHHSAPAGAIVVCAVHTVLQQLPPVSRLLGEVFLLRCGEHLSMEALRKSLVRAGYRAVETVYEHGEFAARGALLDVFPMGSQAPLRIDLDDERIDSLRTFDPETQRSLEKRDAIELLPAREYPLTEQAIACFREHWHHELGADYRNSPVYRDISAGLPVPGAESYLPFFYQDPCDSLLALMPDNTAIAMLHGIGPAADQFWAEVLERYEARQGDLHYPALPPERLFLRPEAFFADCKRYPVIRLESHGAPPALPLGTPPTLPEGSGSRYERLSTLLDGLSSRVLICADSPGRQQVLQEQLEAHGLGIVAVDGWDNFLQTDMPLAITVAPLEDGFYLPDAGLLLLTESQLFGSRVLQRRRREKSADTHETPFRDLAELRPGAPVVHLQHGVGRYGGLERLTVGELTQEFVMLTYADDTRLYVPVTDLALLAPYNGQDPDHAPLHRLGSEQWQKAREKAFNKARDVAAELLALQAQREARGGIGMPIPVELLDQFSEGFPFEETADQMTAIETVLADLAAERSMDRLVCGDVGFGKTEVALRAAFVAVQNGFQVSMLVPTTLLAQQHFETFSDRFAAWPVRVEVLSRFRTAKEQVAVLDDIAAGKVDIVIGTHRLLQPDIVFPRLGLLIVDEEHRFGVRHKEKIKALRAGVDILTLTATPIPRTLNMAFSGLRDLSIIATPPARRLTIRTFVRQHDDKLIREAITREILRGGQVYYLHNDVASIERAAAELQKRVPEATVGIGHGQMSERDLEKVMADFYHRRFNVLVCSTIIETGIDVPNANTIIIDRADRFGLAQLHQLRGRVGRSHHQAYAYLLIPDFRNLTRDAEKRLDAIAEAEDLGAGFLLASQDMEIRGAGELLGDEQSGQIESVGLSLYLDMMQRAVTAIKNGEDLSLEATLDAGPEFVFPFAAIIPESWVPDIQTRLQLYRRIAAAGDSEQSGEALQVEMIDRFGLLPEPVKHLFAIARIKARCKALGIRKLEINAQGIRSHFSTTTQVDPITLVDLIQKEPAQWRLLDAQLLLWKTVPADAADTFKQCHHLLDRLQHTSTPRAKRA
ncbi:MAG TPA: transcription-repair coupling factor [Pseudomonadales bacterium]